MPDRLTEQELQEAERLCEAATPGPWYIEFPQPFQYQLYCPSDEAKDDLLFCAHARTLLPRAVAELRELRDELRIGNSVTAKLTDKCRELEAIVAKLPVTEEQQ